MAEVGSPSAAVPAWARGVMRRLGDWWRARRAATPLETAKAPGEAWGAIAAKWLVPSATVLFALVGYVAQSSQETLLGLTANTTAVEKYSASAGAFFIQILATIVDLVSSTLSWRPTPLDGHFPLLAALAILVLLPLVLQWAWVGEASIGRRRVFAWLFAVLLAGIVFQKFIILDTPLRGLENVVLDLGQVDSSGAVAPRLFDDRTPSEPRASCRTWSLKAGAACRSRGFWQDLVCSRMGPVSEADRHNANNAYPCSRTRAASAEALTGEFNAHLGFAALIALLALAILRSPPQIGPHLMAWAAIAYLLTVPFAYGKLMMSTYFDYGLIRLKPAPETPNGESKLALVLSKGAGGANILEPVSDTCASGGTYTGIRLSSISPSEVRAIEQIYRQDVIVWATRNSHPCTTSAQAPPI